MKENVPTYKSHKAMHQMESLMHLKIHLIIDLVIDLVVGQLGRGGRGACHRWTRLE